MRRFRLLSPEGGPRGPDHFPCAECPEGLVWVAEGEWVELLLGEVREGSALLVDRIRSHAADVRV